MGSTHSCDRYLVVLGLGANLGERLSNLRRAVDELEAAGAIAVVGRSSVYQSPPAGGPPQPPYLNAAVSASTALEPDALLHEVLRVERKLGRIRPDPVRWGPRTIDIDILWSERGAHASAALTIPHPRLRERPFALQPLVELVADARDPETGERYADLEPARVPLARLAAL